MFENHIVRLNWVNTNHPNLDSVLVLRKDSGFSTSPDDGTVISDALTEEAVDATVQQGLTYYYSAYSKDGAGNYSEPSNVAIITYRFSVYGSVMLNSGEGVEDAEIILKDEDEKILQTHFTEKNGQYFFSNLKIGNYTLEASHISHEIQDSPRVISTSNLNVQEDFIANPVPALILLFDFP